MLLAPLSLWLTFARESFHRAKVPLRMFNSLQSCSFAHCLDLAAKQNEQGVFLVVAGGRAYPQVKGTNFKLVHKAKQEKRQHMLSARGMKGRMLTVK